MHADIALGGVEQDFWRIGAVRRHRLIASHRHALPDRQIAYGHIGSAIAVLEDARRFADLDDDVVVEVCAPVGRNDGGTAYRQEVAVARNDIAHDRIALDARHAVAGEHAFGGELTLGNVEHTERNAGRAETRSLERLESGRTGIHHAVDLELGVVGDGHRNAAEVAVPVPERPYGNRIGHLCRIDVGDGSAKAQRLFVDRADFGENKRLGRRDRGVRSQIDCMRGLEIEIELQKRRTSGRHNQSIPVRQADGQGGLGQRHAVGVHDRRRPGGTVLLDVYLGRRVIEGDSASDVGRRRNRRRREELCQVDVLGEVDARAARQGFDDAAVRRLQRQRNDVDRVIQKIAVVIGQAEQHGAALAVRCGIGWITAGRYRRRIAAQRIAAAAATGREAERQGH